MRMLILLLITYSLHSSCKEQTNETGAFLQQDTTQYQPKSSSEFGNNIETKSYRDGNKEVPKKAAETNCNFKDGTHTASVNYHNPKTNHTAKHELQVHVKNCKVIQIDFPNGGWLDEDHIPATNINENGKASLKDDKGRTWNVQLH